jgi:hypothetical protein
MSRKSGCGVALAIFLLLLSPAAAHSQSSGPALRVGTYDSRAIAVAYARSDAFRQWYGKLAAERDKAKAAGDERRVKELEAEGNAQQERFHQQGFGIASVVGLMESIRQEIPGVAKEAGVLLIVSKWEVMYRDPSVEYVDVTMPLVRKFGADSKVLKMVEQLMKQEPVRTDR